MTFEGSEALVNSYRRTTFTNVPIGASRSGDRVSIYSVSVE